MCGAEVRDITHITPIIAGTSGGAAIIGVVVRVWMSGADFWLDDAMCVLALAFAIPMAVLEFLMSSLGFGKDIWTLTPAQIYRIVQVCITNQMALLIYADCLHVVHLADRDLLVCLDRCHKAGFPLPVSSRIPTPEAA